MVIISPKEIHSPIIVHSDVVICLDRIGLELYESSVKEKGVLIINSSLIKKESSRNDVEIIKIPASELAEEVGSIRIANMIVIGAYVEKTKVIKLENVINSLEKVVSKKHTELLKLNELALKKGSEFIKNL